MQTGKRYNVFSNVEKGLESIQNRISEEATGQDKSGWNDVNRQECRYPDPLDQLLEVLGVVGVWEGSCWNGQVQKVAERFPSLLHIEDQEPILRYCPDDLLLPAVVELGGLFQALLDASIHS